MPHKKKESLSGCYLIEELAEATELPKEMVHREIEALVRESGLDKNCLTLDELRTLLIEYAIGILEEPNSYHGLSRPRIN